MHDSSHVPGSIGFDPVGFPHVPDDWSDVALLIDKPTGITSFDVIRRLRRSTGVRKMGHAGTLDPLATGLLIVLIGRATKRQDSLMGMDKRYTGTIRLGEETPSYDAETEVTQRRDVTQLGPDDLETARNDFIGDITQTTPSYSAVKVSGERLYRRARRGEAVVGPPRHVTIHRFDLLTGTPPDIDVDIACSKGTYIRSIAHEFGQRLGVGGHLTRLRRTEIGPFSVTTAWPLDDLCRRIEGAEVA